MEPPEHYEPEPDAGGAPAAGAATDGARLAHAAAGFVHLDVVSCYSLYASPSTPEDYAEALAAQLARASQAGGGGARRNGAGAADGAAGRAGHHNGAARNGAVNGHAGASGDADEGGRSNAPLRAVALADYGLQSAVKMARACRRHGLEHIAGLRVRVVPARAFRSWGERAGELVLLAEDDEGWLNLVALNNLGHVAGWHNGAPRIDWHDLAAHAGGLVCLTGGPANGLLAPALLRTGDPVRQGDALRAAERLRALFGDRLYVELAFHGHASEKLVNRGLIQIAERLELPTVATNAVRYARQDQATAQAIFSLMGRQRRMPGAGGGHGKWGARDIADVPSLLADAAKGQAYLASGREMARLFASRPGDLLATQEIARRCRFRLPLVDQAAGEPDSAGAPDRPERRYGPPRFFPVGTASADGAATLLAEIANAALDYRHLLVKGEEPPEAVRAALRDEVRLICAAGLAELLLTAHQVAGYCAERGIPIVARGSATSSLVAWALGLVEVFPVDHGLSSATFVYEGRPDRPDLDLEVASAFEQSVKAFLQAAGRREGRPQPAVEADGLPFARALRLGTCVSFGSRLAVRQVGAAIQMNEAKTNTLARQVPIRSTPGAIEEVFTQPYEIGAPDVAPHAEPWTTILDVAGRLESLPQRYGVHPSGFTFAFDFAEPRAPVRRVKGGRAAAGGLPGGGEADPPATPGVLRWLPAQWVGSASAPSSRGMTLPRHVAVVAAEEADAVAASEAHGSALAHPSGGAPIGLRPAAPAPGERLDEAAAGEGGEAADGDAAEAWPSGDLDGQPALVCQWDKDDLDALGLVKLDISLSAALTTIAPEGAGSAGATGAGGHEGAAAPDPVRLLEKARREDAAWKLLLSGDTLCIAQVETWNMRKLLKRARESCFEHDDTGGARALNSLEDLAQLLALSKPGARGPDSSREQAYFAAKYGGERPEYPHPSMGRVLNPTCGQVLYSEQLTELLKLTGVAHARAERFRKLLNGGDFAAREALELEIRAAGDARGWTKDQLNALLGLVLTHQGYLHNHGHSLAYAYRVFEQAKLKADPDSAAAFFCEVLNTGGSLQYGLGTAVEEARKHGVLLLPACVNKSQDRFVVEEGSDEAAAARERGLDVRGAIRFPLVAVRGFPAEAAQYVIAVREAYGPYTSLVDFCRRVDRRLVSRTWLQVLIKLGAFSFTGLTRAKLTVLEPYCAAGADLLRMSADETKRALELQEALADGAASFFEVPEWDPSYVAAQDLAYLGCYVAAPVEVTRFAERLKEEHGAVPVAQLRDYVHGERVAVGGVIIAYRERTTRRAQLMAWLTLADGTGAVKCGIWPSAFEQVRGRLALREGTFVVAVGKTSQDETEGTMLWIDEVRVLSTREARVSALMASVERRRTDTSFASWMRQ